MLEQDEKLANVKSFMQNVLNSTELKVKMQAFEKEMDIKLKHMLD